MTSGIQRAAVAHRRASRDDAVQALAESIYIAWWKPDSGYKTDRFAQQAFDAAEGFYRFAQTRAKDKP